MVEFDWHTQGVLVLVESPETGFEHIERLPFSFPLKTAVRSQIWLVSHGAEAKAAPHHEECGHGAREGGLASGAEVGPAMETGGEAEGKLRPPHEQRLRSEWWHVPPSFFLEDPYEGCQVFAVLRCPYRRAISEFRCPWKGFLAPARGEKKEMRLKATKGDLNAWLQRRLRKLGPPFRNGHLIPQHLYIFKDGQPYVAQEDRCDSITWRRISVSWASVAV